MTKSQEKALARIRESVEAWGDGRYEIKRWEVEDHGSFLSLVVQTGMPDDEGTAAEMFARDRAHIFIGPRGGITYPVWRNGRQIERRWDCYSFLTPVVDQMQRED